MKPYYQDDLVTIYHGDCHDILPRLEEPVDLFATDPPYGVSYQSNRRKDVFDKLQNDAGRFSYVDWGREAFRLLRDETALFAFTGWKTHPLHYLDLEGCGFKMKEPLVVQKRPSGSLDYKGSFQPNVDWALFGHKGSFAFRESRILKNKTAGMVKDRGRRKRPEFKVRLPSCWFGPEFPWATETSSAMSELGHPTVKTVEVMQWLIALASDPGGLVVDPFMGTGTTLVAAVREGRRAIGMDVEEKHCATAVRRLAEDKPGGKLRTPDGMKLGFDL